MDWATQPDPFRRFHGAPLAPLNLLEAGPQPPYEAALAHGRVPAAGLDRTSISRLFHDALAISAWKQAGTTRWALRVNPSSGNLHPTEGYLVAGPVSGLHPRPAVFHYAPLEHALELRADLPEDCWRELASRLPDGAVLIGLTSIYWREAWKYGERAFRYCQHDAGHAIGSIAIAAAGLGWAARLLESVTDEAIATLLGVSGQTGVEAEHPDCLMALFPHDAAFPIEAQRSFTCPPSLPAELARTQWLGSPNRLSADHHRWPAIEEVSAATERHAPPDEAFWSQPLEHGAGPGGVRLTFTGGQQAECEDRRQACGASGAGLRVIVHQRRSAVALDGQTGLDSEAFYEILQRVMPDVREVPFAAVPWSPCVDLLLFVHRVAGIIPGLYILLRDTRRRAALTGAMARRHVWERPAGCPESLPLFLLERGDARRVAQQTSCDQEIAADGACAVAMLADYRASLETFGAWHYRRLFWETGVIGQVLYLEAEAHGIRGTGIGCFFDDLTHQLFGIDDDRYQVLYHFTMGGPMEDSRLQTLPPYHHLAPGG